MNRKFYKKMILTVLSMASMFASISAHAADKIRVAYFLEWPTANQVAQVEKVYDKELGVEVEWRSFGNGNEMAQAMMSGDIDIAYAMGFVPFVVGVTSGAPMQLVGVAVTYAENDLCIVRDDAGITQANAKELEGKKVATTIGNVTHYKLIRTLDHLGVDINKVKLVQMNPADAAVALIRGDVTMGCAFTGALTRMKTVGSPLMTGAEQEAVGIHTFDIVAATNKFAQEKPELLKKFMSVTNEYNKKYIANPNQYYKTISKASGMDLSDAKDMLKNFGFPTNAEQLQKSWLGGGMQKMAKGVADVMVSSGNMDKSLDSYDQFVTTEFIK